MSGSLVYDNALFYMQFSSVQISGIQNVRVEFFKFPIMFGFQIFLFFPNVVINEINVGDPSKPELNELSELVNFGKKRQLNAGTMQIPDFTLREYNIFVVSAFQKEARGQTIKIVPNSYNS